MYEDSLTQLGLRPKEAVLYEALLRGRRQTIPELLARTPFKRGDLYNLLAALQEKQLLEVTAVGKKDFYSAAHPSVLQNRLQEDQQKIDHKKNSLQQVLPELKSLYSLGTGRPGVLFYEGLEGVKTVANDSLTAQSEILSYVDIEAVEKEIKAVNAAYMKKRMTLKKKKRILLTKSDFNKYYFGRLGPDEVTDMRFIDFALPDFRSIIQIYDNKMSYITLRPQRMISVIIEDATISATHRGLFEYDWANAKSAEALRRPR